MKPRKKTLIQGPTAVNKNMKQGLYLTTLLLVLAGCDPMRRINMINRSGKEASIIWTIKEDSVLVSPLFLSNAKEVRFDLKANHPYNKINLSAGVGNWKKSDLKDFTDDLESLVIKDHKGSVKLANDTTIGKYLQSRRKGLFKRKIEILIL
jgi:hypothetical protein